MNRVRWAALGGVLGAVLAVAGPAFSQVYYQYPGAVVVSDTEPATGGVFGFGDDVLRFLGYARFNAADVADFGVEVLLDRYDPGGVAGDGWRFGAAADFRYAIIPTRTQLPFDLCVDGGIGFQSGDNVTNIDIPAGAVISRPLELRDGRILVPYGGVYLVYTHVSVDVPAGVPDASDDDLDVELRLGASIELGAGLSAFANVHLGHGDRFYAGVNASL